MNRRRADYLSKLVGIEAELGKLCSDIKRQAGRYSFLDVVRAKLHSLVLDHGERGVDAAFHLGAAHEVSRQTVNKWMKRGIKEWMARLTPGPAKVVPGRQRGRGVLTEHELQRIAEIRSQYGTTPSWRQLALRVHHAAQSESGLAGLKLVPLTTLWRHRLAIQSRQVRVEAEARSRSQLEFSSAAEIPAPDVQPVVKARPAVKRRKKGEQTQWFKDMRAKEQKRIDQIRLQYTDPGGGIELDSVVEAPPSVDVQSDGTENPF